MSGSRKVRVLKRDGTVEVFDRRKLAGALWRAVGPAGGEYRDASELSRAVEIYLVRRKCLCVSSAAILEMAVKVLRRVGLEGAAEAMEVHHSWRTIRRRAIRIRQAGGRQTAWDKGWLAKFVCRSWDVLPATGRTVAAMVENELLVEGGRHFLREDLIGRMNDCVASLGLADTVPVRQYALER